tara:strand:- start:484 stop:705 length:222 start_codon:yes stop_codon:yes gene_type:complete
MDFIMAIVGVVFVVSITTLYMYLVEQNKIEPHIPTTINKIQRGNFWDAETKQFYKWDKLMELKKLREQNDTIQ